MGAGPAFPSNSDGASSKADDYEVLYSVVSPFNQQSSNNTIECPLYLETPDAYQDRTENYTYDVPTASACIKVEEEAEQCVVYDVPNDVKMKEAECTKTDE